MKRKHVEPMCGCTRLVSVGDSPAFTAALEDIRRTLRREFDARQAEETLTLSQRLAREQETHLARVRTEEESAYQL